MFSNTISTPPFSFTEMLNEDFDPSIFDNNNNQNFFPITCKTEPNTIDACIPPPLDAELTQWITDYNKKNTSQQQTTRKRNISPSKKISKKKKEKVSCSQKKLSPQEIEEKKINEKEKHKVRQRQRRQRMTETMDKLKSLIPECVKRESEVSTTGKKKKVDQTQLLEMTVEYIQDLHTSLENLQQENNILRACMDNQNNNNNNSNTNSPSSDISSDSSQLSPETSPTTSLFYDTSSELYEPDLLDSSSSLLSKRNLSTLYNQNDIIEQYPCPPKKKQPIFVQSARILMAIFVVGLIFYNPLSYPTSTVQNTSPIIGRVLQSSGTVLTQSPAVSTSWFLYFSLSFIVKLLMIMFWTFGAMLLDHIYVPPAHLVKLAKKENNIGVKKFDKGDYHASRRHFEKAMSYLGRNPRPSIFFRIFHLPLEMWRQVLHLLRIGLWCDVHLVHYRGGQAAMLEVARSNHYLFTLNVLSNTIDSHSVLYFLVSLNAAESLYQKPPVLAEVYATVAIAFYGLLKMPKAYQYLMGKAWHIVDNYKEEKLNDSSVDNTKALLLFLSSYGSLCDGNLQQVQTQIQHGCDLFLKEGNKNMFFQGQFFISYTHFLRGNYFTTMQIMKSIEVCNLGDPRISWWRELLIISCKLCLHDTVTEKDLTNFEMLYSKVESHSTFAPTLAVLQNSILALLLFRLGNKKRAFSVAVEALDVFENSSFIGWIFYCGFYISEVFFNIWEDETNNDTKLKNQISNMTYRLCTILKKVGKYCELARPISFMVIGRYALNMREYSKAINYLEMAAESAEDCKVEAYKVQASCLIDRTRYESNNSIYEDYEV